MPTAVLVVEILSPGDETFAKFDFYAEHGVGEILVADPREHSVLVHRLVGAGYERVETSLLGLSADDIEQEIDWPPA